MSSVTVTTNQFGSYTVLSILGIRLLNTIFHYIYNAVSQKYTHLNDNTQRNVCMHSSRVLAMLLLIALTFPGIIDIIFTESGNMSIPLSQPYLYTLLQIGGGLIVGLYLVEMCYKSPLHWATVLHHVGTIAMALVVLNGWPLNLSTDTCFVKLCLIYSWYSGFTFFTHIAIVLYRLLPTTYERYLPKITFAAFINDLVCVIIFQIIFFVLIIVEYNNFSTIYAKVLIWVLFITTIFAEFYVPYVLWALHSKVCQTLASKQLAPQQEGSEPSQLQRNSDTSDFTMVNILETHDEQKKGQNDQDSATDITSEYDESCNMKEKMSTYLFKSTNHGASNDARNVYNINGGIGSAPVLPLYDMQHRRFA